MRMYVKTYYFLLTRETRAVLTFDQILGQQPKKERVHLKSDELPFWLGERFRILSGSFNCLCTFEIGRYTLFSTFSRVSVKIVHLFAISKAVYTSIIY